MGPPWGRSHNSAQTNLDFIMKIVILIMIWYPISREGLSVYCNTKQKHMSHHSYLATCMFHTNVHMHVKPLNICIFFPSASCSLCHIRTAHVHAKLHHHCKTRIQMCICLPSLTGTVTAQECQAKAMHEYPGGDSGGYLLLADDALINICAMANLDTDVFW
jgi:hypothetical protein